MTARVEERCAAHYAENHPADTAQRLERMPAADTVAFLDGLPSSVAAGVLEQSSGWVGARCFDAMKRERAAEVLERLTPDAALRSVRPLKRDTRSEILASCSSAVRGRLERQLRYPPGTVGAVMDPLVLALPEETTVGDAVKELRRVPDRVYYYLYVLNRDDQLVGVLDIRELVAAPAKEPLSSVMKRDVVGVSPESELAGLESHPAWRDVDALPVRDRAGRLLGLIRNRTLRRSGGTGTRTGADTLGTAVVGLAQLYWDALALMVNTGVAVLTATPGSATERSP